MNVENYQEELPGGFIVATFDVYLEGMKLTLRKLKLCVSKKGNHFIGYPNFCVEKVPGDKKWIPYFDFSAEKKKEFENAVWDELMPLIKGPIRRSQQEANG